MHEAKKPSQLKTKWTQDLISSSQFKLKWANCSQTSEIIAIHQCDKVAKESATKGFDDIEVNDSYKCLNDDSWVSVAVWLAVVKFSKWKVSKEKKKNMSSRY